MLLSRETADCQIVCATVSRGAWVRKKGTLPCNLRFGATEPGLPRRRDDLKQVSIIFQSRPVLKFLYILRTTDTRKHAGWVTNPRPNPFLSQARKVQSTHQQQGFTCTLLSRLDEEHSSRTQEQTSATHVWQFTQIVYDKMPVCAEMSGTGRRSQTVHRETMYLQTEVQV